MSLAFVAFKRNSPTFGERYKVKAQRLKVKGQSSKVKGERLKVKGERLKVKGFWLLRLLGLLSLRRSGFPLCIVLNMQDL